MKRTISLLVAGLFFGLFVLSSNSSWMKSLAQYRYASTSIWQPDKYRYGDLYGFSFLHDYRQTGFGFTELRPYYVHKKSPHSVELYSICDSYLWTFMPNDSLFSHANSYRFTRWGYEAKQFHLDSTKQNILLLEIVERQLRTTLKDTAYIYKHLSVVNAASKESEQPITPLSPVEGYVFNKNIEANLEFNLFDYSFFTPFKELKARLNYSVFNRTNHDVVVSKTKRQLYYAPTIDSAATTSSFKKISAGELAMMVTNLNRVYRHYRRAGFKQVYLAAMPNPVTILEPKLSNYNELIPRLQHHPALQMPVIDVYISLQHHKSLPIYRVSDSHWDKDGFLLGVAQIDSVLATQNK
ncbi:MAG: hypothetical protein ACRYFV_15840 [Janthinobacterium lividum]